MNDKHSNHIKAFLEYSCRTAADLLFPRRCPVCGGVAMPKGRLICPACLKQLSFVSSPTCMKCGKEIGSREQEYCADCIRRKKSFTRGFNQAAVLAEKLSAELGIPWEELLIRVKKTDPQKSLGSAERLKNLRGAFEAEQEAGKWERVLLVDDIYTTGSTAEICSRALLKDRKSVV